MPLIGIRSPKKVSSLNANPLTTNTKSEISILSPPFHFSVLEGYLNIMKLNAKINNVLESNKKVKECESNINTKKSING